MPRILPVVLAVAVVVFALIDCARTPEDRMPARIPKAIWVILILLLPVIAAVAWLILSRVAVREQPGGGTRTAGRPFPGGPGRGPVRPGRAGRPSGRIAPDDDPEFLARLEAERRRRERERRQAERDAAKRRERGGPSESEGSSEPDRDEGAGGDEGPGDEQPAPRA